MNVSYEYSYDDFMKRIRIPIRFETKTRRSIVWELCGKNCLAPRLVTRSGGIIGFGWGIDDGLGFYDGSGLCLK